MSASRMANGNGEWFNPFYGKQCHVWRLYSFLVYYWLFAKRSSSFTQPLRACSYVEYFTPNFVKLEQCASYQGSRQSLSRRQYAPNKQCALNNDVCLITQFYGIQVSIIAKSLSTKLIIIRRLYVCTVSSSFVPRPKEEEEEGPGFSSGFNFYLSWPISLQASIVQQYFVHMGLFQAWRGGERERAWFQPFKHTLKLSQI